MTELYPQVDINLDQTTAEKENICQEVVETV